MRSTLVLAVAAGALVFGSTSGASGGSSPSVCAATPRAPHSAPGLATLSKSWWHRNRVWMGVAGAFHGQGFVADPRGQKIGWYRERQGTLQIYAKRLYGPAASFAADVPPYYGRIGFQPSGITFGAVGCWAVTAVVGGQPSRFVVRVAPAP